MVACLCAVSPAEYPWACQDPQPVGILTRRALVGVSVRSTHWLAGGCGFTIDCKTLQSWHVSQAESLAWSCCLNPFSNSQWFCEALNPTNFPRCTLLQNFEGACSMSQWSWADCISMRHLSGSPPEQKGLILGKFPSTSLGRELNAQWDCWSSGPSLKRMVRNRRNLLVDWNPKQKNCTVLKKGELHTLKAKWWSFGKIISFFMLAIISLEGKSFCTSPPLQPVVIDVWI